MEFRTWPTWIMLITLTKTGKSDFRTVNLGLGLWLRGNGQKALKM